MSRQPSNDVKANARRAIRSFDQTFSKGGRRPQPIRALQLAKVIGKKKFAQKTNFCKVLIKKGGLEKKRGTGDVNM